MRYEILDVVGNVTNTIEADDAFCQAHFPHYRIAASQATVQQNRTLTKLEYMSRFTDAELVGIYTTAKTNVAVEIWLEKFKLASEINLDDQATVAGLQAMESGGLLTAGRSAVILA
jgi:hypothetical protein